MVSTAELTALTNDCGRSNQKCDKTVILATSLSPPPINNVEEKVVTEMTHLEKNGDIHHNKRYRKFHKLSNADLLRMQTKTIKKNKIANKQNSKNITSEFANSEPQQKLEDIEEIGNFLLHLYCRLVLKQDFSLIKYEARQEFKKYFKLPERHGVPVKMIEAFRDVGTSLRQTGFLRNTPRGSNYFQIDRLTFFNFKNAKLKEMDNKCKNGVNCDSNTQNSDMAQIDQLDTEHPIFEVDPDSKEYLLYYKGGRKQKKLDDFQPTNLGCFICQENYPSQEKFEDHVQQHSGESDFESLKDLIQLKESFFNLSYRLCKKSHYFCFTMKTKEKDVVIDKIIIVQTRSMYYIKNAIVPYEMDGTDTFFVDSHMFTKFVEQPIVIVFHWKFDKKGCCVEQHHFIRTEEFPRVYFRTMSVRLNTKEGLKIKYNLPNYMPSVEMKSAQTERFSSDSLCRASMQFKEYLCANKNLVEDSMASVYNILLQIEDLDSLHKYLNLYQRNAKISRFGKEYSVELNQHASKTNEKLHASTIINPWDEIILIPSKKNYQQNRKLDQTIDILMPKLDKHLYVASVEKVNNNRVFFTYYKSSIPDDCDYNVVFRPSRSTLIYQYRALELLSSNRPALQLLFPKSVLGTKPSTIQLELFNPTIANCAEQLQAVQNIAEGPLEHAPYIIFGPPGTGKTTTIVEAILQLWKNRPSTRILVTAGSNSACDEVALRLCKIFAEITPNTRQLLRIFSKSNDKRLDSIDELLLESSNMFDTHFYPAVELIESFRIVVCTLSVIGRLVTGDFGGNNFFSHIFVDEAAASTEPEVLVGLMGTLSTKCRLIISGDHKQLGAILHSEISKEHGLDISIMERLLSRSCYAVDKNGDYDRSIQTRLRSNHRSHFEIVNIFNHLFYDSELVARANLDDVNMGTKWHGLSNPKFPIIFHSVFGTSQKNNMNSLHNYKEIEVVMEYVKDLMYFGINGKPIKQSDIGIISPYKSQYTLIQEELNLRHWYKIETGSVEIFQGKEKPIVVVSMVRSYTKTLGFLDSPRRLNVTLSRAKSLLIVIGNPVTLSASDDFKYLIRRCKENNSFIGSSSRWNHNKIVNCKSYGVISDNVSLSLRNLDISTANLKTNQHSEENQTQNEENHIADDIGESEEILVVEPSPKQMSTNASKNQNTYQAEEAIESFPLDNIFWALPSVPKEHVSMPKTVYTKPQKKLQAAVEPMPRRAQQECVIQAIEVHQKLSFPSVAVCTKPLSPEPKSSLLSSAPVTASARILDPSRSTEVIHHYNLSVGAINNLPASATIYSQARESPIYSSQLPQLQYTSRHNQGNGVNTQREILNQQPQKVTKNKSKCVVS